MSNQGTMSPSTLAGLITVCIKGPNLTLALMLALMMLPNRVMKHLETDNQTQRTSRIPQFNHKLHMI